MCVCVGARAHNKCVYSSVITTSLINLIIIISLKQIYKNNNNKNLQSFKHLGRPHIFFILLMHFMSQFLPLLIYIFPSHVKCSELSALGLVAALTESDGGGD